MPAIRLRKRLFANHRLKVSFALILLTFGAGLLVFRTHELPISLYERKLIDELPVPIHFSRQLLQVTAPAPKEILDGYVRASHPRILLPQLREWDGREVPLLFRERAAAYERHGIHTPSPCINPGLLGDTACWLITGNEQAGHRALAALLRFHPKPPRTAGYYGDAWKLALAYDLLSLHPDLSGQDRSLVQLKLQKAIEADLLILDDDSASLWHGRATLASDAWLCALELDPSTAQREDLIRRAQSHFIDVMRALALVVAWPEGYNYWINSRAFLLVLAASGYINSVEDSRYVGDIRRTLEGVGLWTLYATRPDGRIEGFGDEGPRVDLKDETRRVIDIIAQTTQDPIMATFSRYLGHLHGQESYYVGYRWGFWLFNDPNVPLVTTVKPGTLQGLSQVLPGGAIFGRDAMNMAYIRSGWGPDDTFISFHAGDIFTHHGHYDAGHFTIFTGAPLAINSSTYGDFTSPNRLNYSIRTVAKNSLLVLRPGEKVQPNHFFAANVADGGQRVVLPTGSAIRSVKDWYENLSSGLHLQAGRLLYFENLPEQYAYISADLTDAYNTPRHDEGGSGGKIISARRELVYLYGQDRLIVHDDVTTTKATYTKKWLLHTVNKPDIADMRVLKGKTDDGILESNNHDALVRNGNSYLGVHAIYPLDGVMRLVGGPDYQFYVESDGDDRSLNGRNFSQGARIAPWFDVGQWRIEFQPGAARKRDQFLVVMSPSIGAVRNDGIAPLPTSSTDSRGVQVADSLVMFANTHRGEPINFSIPGKQKHIFIFGIPPGAEVTFRSGDIVSRKGASRSGGVVLNLSPDTNGAASISWK